MSATGDRSQSGFTLIEALVVVAITVLIAGLMFPRLQSAVSGQEFRLARSQMILGVRETRALAVRSGAAAQFVVGEDGSAFGVGARAPQPLPSAITLRLAEPRRPVLFFPDGTSNGARLRLSAKGRQEEYIIFPTTGLIVEARQ
jgi:general secretion pathway protein H